MHVEILETIEKISLWCTARTSDKVWHAQIVSTPEGTVAKIISEHTKASNGSQLGCDPEQALDELHLAHRINTA
jgi:hypothetical protein